MSPTTITGGSIDTSVSSFMNCRFTSIRTWITVGLVEHQTLSQDTIEQITVFEQDRVTVGQNSEEPQHTLIMSVVLYLMFCSFFLNFACILIMLSRFFSGIVTSPRFLGGYGTLMTSSFLFDSLSGLSI